MSKNKDFTSGNVRVRVKEPDPDDLYPKGLYTIQAGNRSVQVSDISEAEDFLDAFAQFVLENNVPDPS